MSKIRNYILWAIAILFVVSLVFNARTCQTSVTGTASDTTRVTVYDTIPFIKPPPKDSVVIRYITERLPVADVKEENFPIKDTTNHIEDKLEKVADSETVSDCHHLDRDSVKVQIPITQKVYEDSTYKAYVSGFKPSLDSIFLYPKTEVRTITNKVNDKSRWSISVHGGYGLTLTKQPRFEPYVGIGISYNLYTFPRIGKRIKEKLNK